MNTGFKNSIEPNKGKSIKNPWSYEQVPYDQRSSCFVNAGTYHGVGKKTPVGTENVSQENCVPKGRVDTLSLKPPYDKTNIV